MDLKISSLNALATASKTDLSAEELVQHIAADMLLCSFEVEQTLLLDPSLANISLK